MEVKGILILIISILIKKRSEIKYLNKIYSNKFIKIIINR